MRRWGGGGGGVWLLLWCGGVAPGWCVQQEVEAEADKPSSGSRRQASVAG